MKLNRKHLTTILATLLLATLTHSATAYSFMLNGLAYNINSGGKTVTVTRQNSSSPSYSNLNGAITIPATVTYSGSGSYSVTGIDEYAFQGCEGLTSVTIGNSVTTIGPWAFYGCKKLTNVSIPNSVTAIGSSAFWNCTSLTSVNIPNSVTSISQHMFAWCSSLTSVTIPNSVKSIGNYAFEYCSGLTNLSIGNSVTSIGDRAFSSCRGLTSVTIPNSVKSIGSGAFYGCSSLTSVTIPNSVKSIGNYAFEYCSGLTSLSIGNSVTSIGDRAFSSCSGLTSVTIPNSVTTIGGNAFNNCSGLTSVTIPNTVSSIGHNPFSDCSGLTSISVQSSNTKYDSRENCNAIIETATNTLISGCKNTAIPNSVTSIGGSAFRGCSGMTKLTLSTSLTEIGDYAFMNCTSLNNVIFPNSLTSIGDSTFLGCVGLPSVTIPSSVTSIGNSAFYNCSNLAFVVMKGFTPPALKRGVNSGSYVYNHFPNNIYIFIPKGAMNKYDYNNSLWRKYKLRYTLAQVTPHTIRASVVSENSDVQSPLKAYLNGKEYLANSDTIIINDLIPTEDYTIIVNSKLGNENLVDTFNIRTKSITFESLTGSSTQTTITPKFKVYRDDAGLSVSSCGATYYGNDYTGKVVETTDTYYVIETNPITGLNPNIKYYYTPWIVCNGKRCEGSSFYITTQNIGTSSNATTGPTNVEMTGSYNAGDAHVKEAYFTFNGTKMKKISVTGLKPSTTYSTVYTVVTNNGSVNTNMSFKTKDLTMTTQEARMLSDTSPMLIAATNIADVETSCGFEWRRYDAPDEMPSAKVYCPVYGGTMAGVLKNMSPNVYYKYRPFYKASDGTEYYGNWIAFITADAGVTFEPVVYTYKSPEVTQNTATLQGVALPGSSDITEQGFEYWRMTGSKAPTGTVNKVTATGQRMSATVQGLSAGAAYGFRSYVKAGGKTYYGSEEQFTTEKPSGDVNGDGRVNVSDVSALINMILGLQPMDQSLGDVNGDGRVNVSDVTALINIILGIN